jgi:transcriptional regulator GlxA family with amidase domain
MTIANHEICSPASSERRNSSAAAIAASSRLSRDCAVMLLRATRAQGLAGPRRMGRVRHHAAAARSHQAADAPARPGPFDPSHRIAIALNCTKRHLHGVFEQEETTLADYMQALRLDACRRTFQSQEHAARSITDIALSPGYNSPAHFSLVFPKQFGATPSERRVRALPAAD